MNKCLMIHNQRKAPRATATGSSIHMRPGTPNPDMHWTGMVLGRFGGGNIHVQVCGSEKPDGGPELWVSKNLKDHDEEGFKWLMNFVRSEDLSHTVIEDQCELCSGHPACVAVRR